MIEENASFEEALKRSRKIEEDIKEHKERYRVLTGDRPTGSLHIGHLFGSLANRVRIQNEGIETFIVIADYQVLTDRESAAMISQNIKELTKDYIAAGLDPENGRTFIFPHSHIPELNQLLLPFLFLVTNAELDRNPTVKAEIKATEGRAISSGTYIYPVHQAADILAIKGNLVPVGKDQLPHLEITRTITKRFNKRFPTEKPTFYAPEPLLSEAPMIMGLDGSQKMSKSLGNTIMLKATADETVALIKKAKTDSERIITYDPLNRPEVSNLLKITSLCTGELPEVIAERIGDGGAGKLKAVLAESLNEYLAPLRARRLELEGQDDYIRSVLTRGIERARAEASDTLDKVRSAMNMTI